MRPARLVTGTAASAVAIATLGFLAGPSAYADDAGAPQADAAGAVSRTTGDLGAQATTAGAAATTAEKAAGDDSGGDETGSGTDNPFSLDNLSGLVAPSLLDSASGGDFSGLDVPGGSDTPSGGDDAGRAEDAGRDEKTDQGEDAGQGEKKDQGEDTGRDEKKDQNEDTGQGEKKDQGEDTGRDEEAGQGESSSGRDDSSSSEHDNSSSGHRPGDAPAGPTGHVKTGVGGSVRPDTTQIAAGTGVLAVTAVGGAWLLRRRASGTQGDG
ncbi:hypothetical protein [Streptomyces sp. NPDC001880]